MNLCGRVLLTLLIVAQQGFSYYNERKYEGAPEYEIGNHSVQTRLEIIDSFLPDHPIVFEAGAYNGDDSVKLAKMWPTGLIFSFEPNPNAFRLYEEKSKDIENMFGYNLALNTYNGTTDFFLCWGTGGTDPIFEGASSLLEPSEEMKIHYVGPKIEVPCVVLDDWCEENYLSQIDFMWLDLEGFELQLFKSSPNILKTVKVIYTETNFFKFREGTTQYASLRDYLTTQGFTMIAHWYNEGLQGDAIFVRNELLKK